MPRLSGWNFDRNICRRLVLRFIFWTLVPEQKMFRKRLLTVSGDPLSCHLISKSCLQNHGLEKGSCLHNVSCLATCSRRLHTQDRRHETASFFKPEWKVPRVWSSGCCSGPENSPRVFDSQFCFLPNTLGYITRDFVSGTQMLDNCYVTIHTSGFTW